ncbi:hypothetical protein Y032_0507g2698 [Ancylostoma ceylanicum]|uniref:Uncharacterized protein n=1 Tax=Ancylostoma ceylanicum TaxID=53326 RepID=A0A016WUU6_9BILA|nr:hypothetical protein Y032_0507g2698 [Ancylostoma ceylanicum]
MGLFVLSAACAVRVKQVGVTSGSNAPVRVVWLHPLSPHDDTYPKCTHTRVDTYGLVDKKAVFQSSIGIVRGPVRFKSCAREEKEG